MEMTTEQIESIQNFKRSSLKSAQLVPPQPKPKHETPEKQCWPAPASFKENLAFVGMTGFMCMVDQYYGLPGVVAVLAASKGIATVAQWTKIMEPSAAHRAMANVGLATMVGCLGSGGAHVSAPLALAGSFIGLTVGARLSVDETHQEAKTLRANRV